jgi:chromosome segregation ATPase
VNQEQDDASVGRMVRAHVAAKTKLTQLRGEAQELGKKFEELGRKLRKFSERTTEDISQERPESQQSGLEKFFPSLGGLNSIESYEQHLSKATYENIAKCVTEIPETAKELSELNGKLKPYDLR